MRDLCSERVRSLQDAITSAVENVDGLAFEEDVWQRPGGGGGCTRVLVGNVFEKGGVNSSEVFGELNEEFGGDVPGEGRDFYATGISIVLHPINPMVPTVHANFRYIEKGDRSWFGGGADLTPYYLFEEDARHFHSVWKAACDRHDASYYPRFKKWCDEYFYLPHRGEARGIGGIFFDYLEGDMDQLFAFWSDVAGSFLDAYLPIAERRKSESFEVQHKEFQEVRRGRYVEFNLIYDRGTTFGLKTKGRTESILMSLPPRVRYPYNYRPEPGSREAELLDVLTQPRDWV